MTAIRPADKPEFFMVLNLYQISYDYQQTDTMMAFIRVIECFLPYKRLEISNIESNRQQA